MEAKEIVPRALQIERAAADGSYGDVLTLLCDLDKARVEAEQPEAADIVEVLQGLLRTCPDDGVKKAARSLLSGWEEQRSKDPELPRGVDAARDGGVRGEGGASCADGEEEEEEAASSSGAKDGHQGVRSKCVGLLLASLRPEPPDRDKAAELARSIERRVHERHGSSPLKYKACVRSKVANLRNPKNQHLRRGLLAGSLSPEAFARMSAEEMAGAELRRLREAYSASGVRERQLPCGEEGTPTDRVRCRRCGGWDCRVTQVSRGALFLPAWVRRGGPGEDAMTFVTCGGCGQQWYHSGWDCL